ncbi:MAG: permease [Bacteroidales bacterium]|nr:permease [Bacteroidales bacterium]
MEKYLLPFINLTLEMAPYLLLGFFFAGLLHGFVPRRFYTRYLSGRNLRSVVNAALIGVPLPLCSCGVIPTAMSLRRNGASKGSTVSFLISTPQTGVDSILATGALMGWTMAVIRPLVAFFTGILGGALVNTFDRSTASGESHDDADAELPHGFWARLRLSLHYGFVDMMQDIGKWLVIGLLIAGLITILVPDNFFDALGHYPLLNMLVVLAIALPMYVCATGSIPIAVALMMKGLSPGAALVFLMAGPATNMAAILVINKVLERRALLIYLATIVGCSIAFGLAIDAFIPEWLTKGALPTCCHEEMAIPLWKTLTGIIFVILLVNALLPRHHLHHHNEEISMSTYHFSVKGMSCHHCQANVEKAVRTIQGVEGCQIDLATGDVAVSGDVDPATITSTINALGYTCTPTHP